jgi:hypothetical protein
MDELAATGKRGQEYQEMQCQVIAATEIFFGVIFGSAPGPDGEPYQFDITDVRRARVK